MGCILASGQVHGGPPALQDVNTGLPGSWQLPCLRSSRPHLLTVTFRVLLTLPSPPHPCSETLGSCSSEPAPHPGPPSSVACTPDTHLSSPPPRWGTRRPGYLGEAGTQTAAGTGKWGAGGVGACFRDWSPASISGFEGGGDHERQGPPGGLARPGGFGEQLVGASAEVLVGLGALWRVGGLGF